MAGITKVLVRIACVWECGVAGVALEEVRPSPHCCPHRRLSYPLPAVSWGTLLLDPTPCFCTLSGCSITGASFLVKSSPPFYLNAFGFPPALGKVVPLYES